MRPWLRRLALRLCWLLSANLALSASLHAADPPPLIQEYQRQEQQRIDEEAARRLRQTPETEKPAVSIEEAVSLLPDGQCQVIRKVWLYGADVLDGKTRRSLLAPYLDRCLDNDAIAALARDIQKWYLDAGYITTRTRIKVPQDSLERGNLEIWVFEGRIGVIRTERDTPFDRRRIRSAFPVGPNDVLNIHDLDQGLEQLNRLFSQRFRMQIRPSERPGYSDVILIETLPDTGRFRNRRRLAYAVNNSGVSATGELLHQVEYRQDNLAGYNDSLLLAWQRNTDYDADARASETYRFDASLPWGYWFFRANGYQGSTVRLVPGSTISFQSRSRINTLRLSANRVLRRSARHKTEASLGVEYSRRKTFINDTLVEVASRNVSSLEIGLVETRYFSRSTLILSPSLQRGVPWFGALRDSNGLPDDAPRAEYTLAKLYAYFQQPLRLSSRISVTWQAAFTGQASRSPLFGEKQIVVGGEYSVRGFKENVASGDDGWYLRNDLLLPLPIRADLSLNLRLFADTGGTTDRNSGTRYRLSGCGLGIALSHRLFDARVQVARPLGASNGFAYRDEWITYASLNARWVF